LLAFVLHARASHVRLRSTVLKLVCTHCTCCRESGVKCTVVSQAIRHTNVMLLYSSRGFQPLSEDEDSAPTSRTRSAGEHRTRRGGPCCRRKSTGERYIAALARLHCVREGTAMKVMQSNKRAAMKPRGGGIAEMQRKERPCIHTYIYIYTYFFFLFCCKTLRGLYEQPQPAEGKALCHQMEPGLKLAGSGQGLFCEHGGASFMGHGLAA